MEVISVYISRYCVYIYTIKSCRLLFHYLHNIFEYFVQMLYVPAYVYVQSSNPVWGLFKLQAVVCPVHYHPLKLILANMHNTNITEIME